MIWVEKHRAKTFTEIRGQEAALEKIHSFLNDFGKPKSKIVLIDEVDGLSANDAGGLPVVLELIKETQIPLVITANDIWDKKFNELRKNTELIQLKEVSYRTIQDILIDILRKEKKFINREMLTTISVKAKGD